MARIRIFKEIGRNPPIDWITLVVLTIVILISLCINGYFLYNDVTKGNIQGAPAQSSDSLKNLDKKVLSSVVDNFSEKDETSRKAKAGYTGLPDPSL